MIPTMTSFEQALSAPNLHFKHLRQIEPLLCNGRPAITRTHLAIECEVIFNGQHFLLLLPFHNEDLKRIAHIEMVAKKHTRGVVLLNFIFDDELTMVDSLGNKHYFDIILQALPAGKTLKEAVNHYRAEDLHLAIHKMKRRLDAIGFRHNNLTPSNIIISDNGTAYPMRYWYAEWEIFSDNDISQPLEYIRSHYNRDIDSLRKIIFVDEKSDCDANQATTREGITRRCKGGRYGFVDSDGLQITPFVYSWASDFCEGRAIVARNGKMGVIDNNGRKVVHQIYDTIEFDIESGIFTATRKQYRYLIDYEGKIIQRSEIGGDSNALF